MSEVGSPDAPSARHYGSVDIFLAAFAKSERDDVLVIDNGGRTDEACIGGLVVLETQTAGLAGIVQWGLNRDTPEPREIGLPVFSYGHLALGPSRSDRWDDDALIRARIGEHLITRNDNVFDDDNGVDFGAVEHVDKVPDATMHVGGAEKEQSRKMRDRTSLREQTEFSDHLARRDDDPPYAFRQHLRKVRGAVEV